MASDIEHLTTVGLYVVSKDLPELKPSHGVETIHNKLHAEDVGKLGTVAVAVASGLLCCLAIGLVL